MDNMYSNLSRAQLSFDYLHTNSTTHEFLFGALAELVDNARDASATKISVYSVPKEKYRGGYLLCFLDDGDGMDPNEAADIITFGKSTKKSLESQMIGMYGNGLKSGSMRIGNDLMLFTKKGPKMTAVFLSRSFHEEEKIDEIIVPMPAFDTMSKKPLANTPAALKKHSLEMDIILKYSPFKTEQEFMAEFDRISGPTGTLIILYNMKLLDSGEPELDIKSDPTDILLSNPRNEEFDSDEGLMPEWRSFRAYTSVLYVDPRMRIYIQGKKVRTKRLACCLFKPRLYKYSSNRFKTRAENEVQKCKEEARIAENRAKEAESKARDLENRLGQGGKKDQRTDLRKAQNAAADLRKDAQIKKHMAERKQKSLKDPKTLNFIFGMNIESRSQDGVFVYNSSRLIRMYEKVGPQTDGGVFCSGVVGVVDVPYLVLEPTHNKQDFADAKEFRHLMKAMGEHMVQYWKDIGIGKEIVQMEMHGSIPDCSVYRDTQAQQGVTKFWENFGYVSANWKGLPSADPKYVRKRAMQVQVTLQCDVCLKWRMLPFSANYIGMEFPDDWVCSNNSDPSHNRCSSSEQKQNIPEGLLKKEAKSQAQKAKDLEEDIRKKAEQLEKLQKTRAVTSSREAKALEAKKRREKEREEQERLEREREEKRRKEKEKERARKKAEQERLEKARLAAIEAAKKKASSRAVKSSPAASSSKSTPNSNSRATPKSATRKPAPKSRSTPVSASSTRKRVKTVESSEDEEEEEEEEEEMDEEEIEEEEEEEEPLPPPKRSSRTAAAAADSIKVKKDNKIPASSKMSPAPKSPPANVTTTTSRGSKRQTSAKKDDTSEDEPKVKQPKTEDQDKSSKQQPHSAADDSEDHHDDEMSSAAMETEPDDGATVANHQSGADEGQGDIGTKVEAKIQNKWYSGNVAQVDREAGRWKIRFDKHPKDKYDKWFDLTSPDLKIVKSALLAVPESTVSTAAAVSPSSALAQETANEAPSSSTPGTSTADWNKLADEIANGYRTCLLYFLPREWIMDKDAVSQLSVQDLANFPLDNFFNHYEKGLRKLVSNFQMEAEVAKNKLSSVRKMIAKLLKSINEEFDIDPETDTDQVDELLAACVRQAMQQQGLDED